MALLEASPHPARRSGAWRRSGALLWALASLTGLVRADALAAESAPLEYAVKAAFLVKLAPFVTWPREALARGEFDICVVGEDPFGSALDQAARGQSIDGRPIVVRRLRTVGPDSGCQVVYVGRSRDTAAADALRAMRGAPVLTVTDGQAGVAGGVVRFVVAEGRVRFTIDLGAAQAANLALSSKLLALALSVQRSD